MQFGGGLGLGGPTFAEETTKKEKKSKKKKDKKEKEDEEETTGYAVPGGAVDNSTDYIHIRNQQRNGRKSITSLSGLPATFNVQKILKAFKKELNCNGNIVDDEIHGRVIQIQGDKREEILRFLIDELEINKSRIKVHGS